MTTEFRFWKAPNDRSPVKEFIKSLPEKKQVKVIKKLKMYEKYPLPGLYSSKKLKKIEGVPTVRMEIERTQIRIAGSINDGIFWMLHAYTKSRKAKKSDIETSKKRFKEFNKK